MSGLSPFAGECDVETMGNVTVGKYDFNDEAFDNVSQECIDFIQKLLAKEHGERLTAHQALRHKWVKRKPQYHPTNPKPSSSPQPFQAVYMDKVRRGKRVHDPTIRLGSFAMNVLSALQMNQAKSTDWNKVFLLAQFN